MPYTALNSSFYAANTHSAKKPSKTTSRKSCKLVSPRKTIAKEPGKVGHIGIECPYSEEPCDRSILFHEIRLLVPNMLESLFDPMLYSLLNSKREEFQECPSEGCPNVVRLSDNQTNCELCHMQIKFDQNLAPKKFLERNNRAERPLTEFGDQDSFDCQWGNNELDFDTDKSLVLDDFPSNGESNNPQYNQNGNQYSLQNMVDRSYNST